MAQETKIAFVNINAILMSHPQTKEKFKMIEEYSKQLTERLESKQKEYEEKVKDYTENEKDRLPAINQDKAREIQALQQSIVQFQQTAQQDIQKKQAEEFKPIYDKIQSTIQQVAESMNYTYVISQDTTSNMPLIYGNPTHDLTEKVVAKLKN